MTDRTVPKKAYDRVKTRVKPPPAKIMVKRDVERRQTFSDEDDMIKIDDNEEEMDISLTRSRRSIRTFHGFGPNQLSPLSVTYAANYNEKENKEWVKPLFSSIVYRLPVSRKLIFIVQPLKKKNTVIRILQNKDIRISLFNVIKKEICERKQYNILIEHDFRIFKKHSSFCCCW